MTKKEQDALAALRKKMKCSLTDCGSNFVFNVNEDYLTYTDHRYQRYTGTCSKCHTSIKITSNQMWLLEKHFGEPKFNIKETTYDQLFESSDDPNNDQM